jgi:hypothetical protein
MLESISKNIRISFEFVIDTLVGYWLRWIILSAVICIPVINFIGLGYIVKICKGGNSVPELEGYVDMFVDGINISFILFTYIFVSFIILILILFSWLSLVLLSSVSMVAAIGVGVGLVLMVGLVVSFIRIRARISMWYYFFILGPLFGCIRFAKTGWVLESFNYVEILATIKKAGGIYCVVSCLIFGIMSIIPIYIFLAIFLYISPIIGLLLFFIMAPPFVLWTAKFFENLYSHAEDTSFLAI